LSSKRRKPYQARIPTREELQRWWPEDPPAWAVVTGKISGIVVLDFDGSTRLETLSRLHLNPHVRTGSGGAHWYVRHPGWTVRTVNGRSKLELGRRYPGLDIRGDFGYAILAGQNQNGRYAWVRSMRPDPLEELPEELREFLGLLHPPSPDRRNGTGSRVAGQRPSSEILIQHALELIQSGRGRNDAGFLLALQLRDNGYSEADASAVMRSFAASVPACNLKGQSEPYSAEESLHSLRQAYGRAARSAWAVVTAADDRNRATPRNGQRQAMELAGIAEPCRLSSLMTASCAMSHRIQLMYSVPPTIRPHCSSGQARWST
jgi:hypothetical protein